MTTPLLSLLKKLQTPLPDEEQNLFTKTMRLRFLEIFINVNNACTDSGCDMTELSALNFFTLHELNIIKIIFRKLTSFNLFLGYFTKKNFLDDECIEHGKRKHPTLDYFITKINLRYTKVRVKSKFIKNTMNKTVSFILMKLERMSKLRKKFTKDIFYNERKIIHELNLAGYLTWCIRIGQKFTNRRESDESNFFCLTQLQEEDIHHEERREELKQSRQ